MYNISLPKKTHSMDLKTHYDKLYKESMSKIKDDELDLDLQIDSPFDFRQGITLVFRPPIQIQNRIQTFIDKLREAEPEQYYYPNSDLHCTAMSIISCYSDFKLENCTIGDYVKIIEKSLATIPPFEIDFKGITASPAAILIQGFTNDLSLSNLRTNLRDDFSTSELEQSIDKRYSIATAHATVMRFQKKFKNKEPFIRTIEDFRNYDFGSFKVQEIDLVCNDWYQKQSKVQLLHRFHLK